jgi:hypothetical protein
MTVVEPDRITLTMVYDTYQSLRRYLGRRLSVAAVGKDSSSLVGGGYEKAVANLASSSSSGQVR